MKGAECCERAKLTREFDHEDHNRIRSSFTCSACGARVHMCFAKRLDADGAEAWGPVGKWTKTVVRVTE